MEHSLHRRMVLVCCPEEQEVMKTGRRLERAFQETLSVGQVVIILTGQLALAMRITAL